MSLKLLVPMVLKKEYGEDQQVDLGEDVRGSDSVLDTVPEHLRPLLWEMHLLQAKVEEVKESVLTGEIDGQSFLEFLADKDLEIEDLEDHIEVLYRSFWLAIRNGNHDLKGLRGLKIRKGYLVVQTEEGRCKKKRRLRVFSIAT